MVGTGSKRQVDGLDGEIIEVSWRWSIGEILSKYISGFTAVSKVPVRKYKGWISTWHRRVCLTRFKCGVVICGNDIHMCSSTAAGNR